MKQCKKKTTVYVKMLWNGIAQITKLFLNWQKVTNIEDKRWHIFQKAIIIGVYFTNAKHNILA